MEPIYRLEKVFWIIKIINIKIKRIKKKIKRIKKKENWIIDELKRKKGLKCGTVRRLERRKATDHQNDVVSTSYSTRAPVIEFARANLVAAEDGRTTAEDGRTTAEDAEQAFHRAVGVQIWTDADYRLILMIIGQLMADYDELRLVFDDPSVYRSNYSFDLRLSAANMILGRVHPRCSTKCLKELGCRGVAEVRVVAGLDAEPVQRSWAPEVGCSDGLVVWAPVWSGSDCSIFLLLYFFSF